MSSKKINSYSKKIRFPEFEKEGTWNKKTLGQLATEISEKVGNRSFKLMSITSGVGLVSQIEKFGREIAGESVKNYLVLKRNDFAYNKSSTKLFPEGEIAILENEESGAVPNSIFSCFRFDTNVINPKFIKYPFLGNIHGKWLKNFLSVGARANGALQVNQKDLFALPIAYPSLAEQQKIADCLSSLDSLITAHTQKLDALKAHKKGLLQQLFPAEGEKVPRLRFPEFKDSEEWEEKKLESVCKKISDGIHTTPTYDDDGDFYFINGNNLIAGKIYVDEKTKKVSEQEYQKHKKELNHNSILLSINGTIGNIASYNNEKVVLGKSACYINVNEHEAVKEFISHYLSTEVITRYFNTELTGSTIKNLSLATIKNTEMGIPSLTEQQKIAFCLSSVDDLITAQTERIVQFKLHKKGLMQGLFPSMDSMNN